MKRPSSASPSPAIATNDNHHQRHHPHAYPSTPQPHNNNNNSNRLTHSNSLTDYPVSDQNSTVGGRSTSMMGANNNNSQNNNNNSNKRHDRTGSRSTILGYNTKSTIGTNSHIGRNTTAGTSSIGNNHHTNSLFSGSANRVHDARQANPQLFEAGGAGASRRALLYDMERHKLESLPLTRLFRFLADSPHWFTDASGSSSYAPTETGGGGKPSSKLGSRTNSFHNGTNNNNSNNNTSHHAMIKNLVVASPEGGRHVSKRQRDIDRARLASVLSHKHDDLIIPDTIVWEASIPRGWFYTSFDGTDGRATVQRRSVDIGTIEKQWTEGLPPHAVAGAYYTIAERDPAAALADKDTPLLQFQFLRACELSKFLHVQATQTSGSDCAAILQQFTYPLHAHNVVIQAAWSPRVLNITIRQNVNALHDDRLDANSRACTFEGSPHLSLELRPTTRLYGQVESAINTLTKHFAAVDLKNRIVRLVAYFKVDKESRLNLLYVPSVRVLRTALIERPIGLRSSPFFSSFRVALDFAVEYETLAANANAWAVTTSSSSNNKDGNDNNNNNTNTSSNSTLISGGGGSRIRKSASKKTNNNNSNDKKRGGGGKNRNKNDASQTGEGSRLLSDALDKALEELHLDRHTQALAMAKSNEKSKLPDENGNYYFEDHKNSKDGGFYDEEEDLEVDSIQYKLTHSPVIGQQRAELVEIVMEIVRASHNGKETSKAVTRAYRHAATPTARDALKWAAVEAGMICRDDDGFSHPFFEVPPELEELMMLICEDYRVPEASSSDDDDDDKNNNKDGKHNNSNNNNNRDLSDLGSGASSSNRNNNNNIYQFHSFDSHSQEFGGSMGIGMFSSQNVFRGGTNNNSGNTPQASSWNVLNSPSLSGQQHHNNNTNNIMTPKSLLISPAGGSLALPHAIEPAFMIDANLASSMMLGNNSNNNNNNHSPNNHQHYHHPPQPGTWGYFAHILKSAVTDFVYELVDCAIPAEDTESQKLNSMNPNQNSLLQDYFSSLGSVSRDAAQVCEIVLETCRSAAVTAYENDQSHPSVKRSLPLAVGSLWADVSTRDAVAILCSAVFGLMYVPERKKRSQNKNNNSVNDHQTQQQQQSSSSSDNANDDDFYNRLKEKERLAKENEREKRKQQFLKEQQEKALLEDPSSLSSPQSAATLAIAFDKQEDVSILFEGLSNQSSVSSSTLMLMKTDVVIRSEEKDLSSLRVSIKNSASLSLECQVRKVLSDVIAALERSHLDLLLPEVAEERRKMEQQQQNHQHQSPNHNKNNNKRSSPISISRLSPDHNNNHQKQQQQHQPTRRKSSSSMVDHSLSGNSLLSDSNSATTYNNNNNNNNRRRSQTMVTMVSANENNNSSKHKNNPPVVSPLLPSAAQAKMRETAMGGEQGVSFESSSSSDDEL